MKKSIAIVGTLIATAAVIALIFWVLLPYPVSIYRQAKRQSSYHTAWPISKADFKSAEGLVRSQLGFFEIIDTVHIEAPAKITFTTLKRWDGPLAGAGRTFVVEKQHGKWVLRPEVGYWVS